MLVCFQLWPLMWRSPTSLLCPMRSLMVRNPLSGMPTCVLACVVPLSPCRTSTALGPGPRLPLLCKILTILQSGLKISIHVVWTSPCCTCSLSPEHSQQSSLVHVLAFDIRDASLVHVLAFDIQNASLVHMLAFDIRDTSVVGSVFAALPRRLHIVTLSIPTQRTPPSSSLFCSHS